MQNTSTMEALLAKLEPLLNGRDYQVFLRVYSTPFTLDATAEWYIGQALGTEAIIGGVIPITGSEVISEVQQSLRYSDVSGSGTKPSVLQSRRFKELEESMLVELEKAITEAVLLVQFWLRDGHPAYPVFWDFAYVIAGPMGGMVFIGSSSD